MKTIKITIRLCIITFICILWAGTPHIHDILAVTAQGQPAQTDGEDDYEPDNDCIFAHQIQPNGIPQSHNFHEIADDDWVFFQAPQDGVYQIRVDIPYGSSADVDFSYFRSCTTLPSGLWTETFTPEGRLNVDATAGETFYIRLNNSDGITAGPDVNYNISVSALSSEIPIGAAIIVAGRWRFGDPLQYNINNTAQMVLNILRSVGMASDDIFFLASDLSLPESDSSATRGNLRFAITNWAVERVSDRQRLTIYMVSHGNRDEFYLDMLHGELLTPHDLDQWLTELEIAVPGLKSNIIIEASHSGSFIEPNNEGERNSISGENRVIITSSDPNYDAYTSHYGMHFTDNFLSKLVQGISLAGSFQAGYTIVESLYVPQSPWLDANSNGQPNEREDYSIAEAHGFRFEDSLGQNWSPFIAQVSPPTNIVDRRGRIYAEVRDNKGVDEVWAVIYPPDYVPPVADGELNREIQDIVLLQRTSGSDTNGDYYGDYLGFAEPGVYRILIHARDRDDMQAQPVMMTVQVSNDTLTPTSTSTDTPVQSTSTFTPMPTNTPTHTPTNVPTSMPTIPETNTSTPTMTPMPTNIPSPTMTPSSTFTPSPTPAPQDDYESDNTCDLARSIQPSGIPQSHTFHTAGDTDWATFTAPTSGVYRIEVTVPSGSPADVDLYYYTDCNAFHRSQFVGTHAPGARIDVTVDEDEVGTPYYIKIKHFDPLQFGPNVIYNLSVRPLPPERDEEGDLIIPGAAIIVAGRYSYVDTVQDNIDQTALAAYNLFHGKGRNHSEIFFLATNSTLPHVDGEATLRNLEIGIKDEARRHLQKENVSQVLSLYLVDHGGPNEFYLDRPNEEVLTPDHLHNWLTDLEEEFPDLLVNVFIEACNAGSFITPNGGSISKDNRVIITSSDEDYDAYTSLRGTLFSDNFLSFLGQEHNLAYSFETSMRIVQEHHDSQEPWIDANGNGIPNELEDMSKASLRSFADSWTLGSEWPPYIADVQPMMHTRSDVTHLHAEVRHEFDNGAIDDVWAVVYPPSYTADTEEPSSNGDGGSDGLLNSDTLDVIEFSAESDDAKALFVGAYADFTEMGVYQIVVHALDNKGLHAQPVTVALDTMALYGHQIFLPTVSR